MSLELSSANSWVEVDEATEYFEGRYGSGAWDALTPDPSDDLHADKKKALVTAYRQLSSGLFTGLPGTPTQAMKDAQCEQALFLLQQGGDNDLRGGLQAQGVTAAGVVKEQYNPDSAGKLAICPAAMQLLKDYYTPATGGVFGADLTRDEDA